MTITPTAVQGGRVWQTTPATKNRKQKTLKRLGATLLTLGVITSLYTIIYLIGNIPHYYKTSHTIETFTTGSGIWQDLPWTTLAAILISCTGLILLRTAAGYNDYITAYLSVFCSLLIGFLPFFITAPIIDASNQPQVNTAFAEWLKTEHNIVINSSVPQNPVELASKPRLLEDPSGNPTLVTFKTYDNTIVFEKTTQK